MICNLISNIINSSTQTLAYICIYNYVNSTAINVTCDPNAAYLPTIGDVAF